jgi:hypothetical protein
MGHPNVTPDTQGKDAGHMADLRAQFRDGDTSERTRIKAQLGPTEVEFADIRMVVDPRDQIAGGFGRTGGRPQHAGL